MTELFVKPIVDTLMAALLPVLTAVVTIIGAYVLRYVRLKLKMEEYEARKQFAVDAVVEVEEIKRASNSASSTSITSSEKQSMAEKVLVEKAESNGISIPNLASTAFSLVKWGVGKIR